MRKFFFFLQRFHFFTLTIFFFYFIFCLFLFFSGKVLFLIRSDYAFLLLLSALAFFSLFLGQIIHIFYQKADKGCHDFFYHHPFLFLLLFLPILLGFLFPPKPLSSKTAELRISGYNTDTALSRDVDDVFLFAIESEKRTLLDWIRLFSENPEPDFYEGSKIKAKGFVFFDKTLPDDYFSLSQFVMSCCTADARPVGIPVYYDKKKFQFKNDQWIELEGVFESAVIHDDRQPIILLKNFKSIPTPQNPYEIE